MLIFGLYRNISVPFLFNGVSISSCNCACPAKRFSNASPLITIVLWKSSSLVLIFMLSNEVKKERRPVPYLPVLILFSLGDRFSLALWGEPTIKNLLMESASMPASSSMTTLPLPSTVTIILVASSSKAFSINSRIISYGEIQVFVANSLKKEGWTFSSNVNV